METTEQFQQNRRVIEEFAARTLAPIPSEMGRLLQVASRRDEVTDRYRDDDLAATYTGASVHQALEYCHQELFARILGAPLERQYADLQRCLADFGEDPRQVAALWLESQYYRSLIPPPAPRYLRDLFCSNLKILLRLLVKESASPE
jgi:hypothetical protein